MKSNTLILVISVLVIQVFNTQEQDTFDFKVSAIQSLITSKKWNCTDVVKYFLDRTVRYNPNVNAIISLNPKAMQKAVELDNYFFKNNKLSGKLHCIPVIVKDNIDVAGVPTTAGVNALRNSVPNKNALVVERLAAEGAIFISKGNLKILR